MGQAKEAALRWLHVNAGSWPGYLGSFLFGSAAGLGDAAELPRSSDVDVAVVLEDSEPPKVGKIVQGGALLDVTFLSWRRIRSSSRVLGQSQLAGACASMQILSDSTGRLRRLREGVAERYSHRLWVRRRYEHACASARHKLERVTGEAAWDEDATDWLFGCSLAALTLPVAGLRPPTVRRRYALAHGLLADHGRQELHEELLGLLGCAGWSEERTAGHLEAVAAAFDGASRLPKGSYRFGSEISEAARPIAIDGSAELMARGLHREAVFWIAATFCRCRRIFRSSAATGAAAGHERAFRRLLSDLRVRSRADLRVRAGQARAFLPQVRRAAAEIVGEEGVGSAISRGGLG